MDLLRKLAVLFGVVFLVVGIAGYVPAWVTDGNLFGIFMVDSVHNIVHILSGAVALYASTRADYARLFFKVFGVIYAVVAVLGFVGGDHYLMTHFNMADNILHLVIAVVALYLGFVFRRE